MYNKWFYTILKFFHIDEHQESEEAKTSFSRCNGEAWMSPAIKSDSMILLSTISPELTAFSLQMKIVKNGSLTISIPLRFPY